jgi:hypothetical protein
MQFRHPQDCLLRVYRELQRVGVLFLDPPGCRKPRISAAKATSPADNSCKNSKNSGSAYEATRTKLTIVGCLRQAVTPVISAPATIITVA